MMPMSGACTSARGSAYKPLRAEHELSRIGFSQRLELRQSQTLVMTPQLQQAIKMLQLSNLELNALIEGEIEQNPLRERSERDPDDRAEPGTEPGDGPVIDRDMAAISEPSAAEAASDAVDDWR